MNGLGRTCGGPDPSALHCPEITPESPQISLISTCKGHTKLITSVAFSANNALVASGSYDKAVIIWDARTGKKLLMLTGHRTAVESVAFSRDSKLVASGSDDDTIKIWDAMTGGIKKTLEGHTHTIRPVAFSDNGRLVVSGSDDRLGFGIGQQAQCCRL